jgi:hypothetical protein
MENNIIWLASFDIGKINFAFYIEEIDLNSFKNIKNISSLKRYNTNGTPTKEFQEILESVCKNGKKILLQKFDLTSKDVDKDKYFDFNLCYNMVDVLDKYEEYWENVDIIVVERQMSFRKKVNTMALKLGQHCESYFINKYGREKKIIEFEAYNKTHVLGAEKLLSKTGKKQYKNMGDYARKKWAIEEAFSILSMRDDYETMSEIGSIKKKDDLCDTIIQLQAFKYLYFIEKSL